MRNPKPAGEPEVPLDVQADIKRQIHDIVEHYGGRRPRRAPRPRLVPLPPGEKGEQRSRP